MSEQNKAAIVIFQMQHDEFLYLCKEYVLVDGIEKTDFKKVWDDFIGAHGFEMNKKYGKYPYCGMVVYHNNNEHLTYCPGTIVEGMDKAPEGFKLMKFPAREYLVVTHEWVSDPDRIVGEDGIGQCYKYQQTVEIPDGYVRYDQPGSQIVLVEAENANTPDGSRWEYWVPIKRSK